ncbi:MAG TPA: class II aldolase family protein, partial [Gammaproteobacteria bacterium]|nr:class II aldolase family protein [Gammaproteobacteria bacterium]
MSEFSNYLEAKLDELVTANRILGNENVCDAFGHVSVRHPGRNDRYFLSRSRAPERVEVEDLMEFTLDGDPVDQRGRTPYAERF